MPTYRDSSGRPLSDYPRPSVAVDTAVLTVVDGSLGVVLAPTASTWRLPGTFVHEGETLADAVRRSLRDKVGIEGVAPTQLHVFDAPGRDERGWVLSVAHLAVVDSARVGAATVTPIDELGELAFDHERILQMAVETLRARYAVGPDPEGLLGPQFTLLELRRMHEAIAGGPLNKDTFRRQMLLALEPTDAIQPGVVGKPARLFRKVAGA